MSESESAQAQSARPETPRGSARGRVLAGLTGLEIDGGIASVSRCIVRALEEEVGAERLPGLDRVLLYDEPPAGGGGRGARGEGPAGAVRYAEGGYARFALALWELRLRRRPDLVFFDQLGPARALGPPLPGWLGGLERLFAAGWPRYAVFCHGAELERAVSGDYGTPLRHAWRLLVNSEHTGRFVREHFPTCAERVRVVRLCIDPARVEAWEARLRARQGPAPAREPAVLIVGRMVAEEPGKGHDALLEAWPEVIAKEPAACLWVVGGGDDVARLEARARTLGLGESVRFLGRVDDETLAGLYERARVFAMPSRQEGFGLVYAEAMWHGAPCIASHADAGAEVVRDGETGRLVPYGDARATAAALLDLLLDPERAEALGRAGSAYVREAFAYPRFARDLLAALELS